MIAEVQAADFALEFNLVGSHLVARTKSGAECWELGNSEPILALENQPGLVHRIIATESGEVFGLVFDNRKQSAVIKKLSASSGLPINLCEFESAGFRSVSRSGKFALCLGPKDASSWSTQLVLINTKTGKSFTTPKAPSSIQDAQFSADETRLLVNYAPNEETQFSHKVFATADGRHIATVGNKKDAGIAWTQNFSSIITKSKKEVALWDSAAERKVCRLPIKTEVGEFSSDNKLLVLQCKVTSADGGVTAQVQIHEAATGKLLRVLPGSNRLFDKPFLPGTHSFLVLDSRNRIRLWSHHLHEDAGMFVGRELTNDELIRFGLPEPPKQQTKARRSAVELVGLRKQVRLLTPVTPERQRLARDLINSWIGKIVAAQDKGEAAEYQPHIRELANLGQDNCDDAGVLELLSELHETIGEKPEAIRLLERASQKSNATFDPLRLTRLRESVFPVLASFQSCNQLIQEDTPQPIDQALAWAKQQDPILHEYLLGLQKMESDPDMAFSVAETNMRSSADIDPSLRGAVELLRKTRRTPKSGASTRANPEASLGTKLSGDQPLGGNLPGGSETNSR